MTEALVGHLIGASGLRMAEGVDTDLQHDIRLGGAAVAGLYRKAGK